MKNLFLTSVLLIFSINAFSQDEIAPKYDLTRPNGKTTSEIQSMTRMVEGSEAFNLDTGTIWIYKSASGWIDTFTSGGGSGTSDGNDFLTSGVVVGNDLILSVLNKTDRTIPFSGWDTDASDDVTNPLNSNLGMNDNLVTGLGDAVSDQDAVNKRTLDLAISNISTADFDETSNYNFTGRNRFGKENFYLVDSDVEIGKGFIENAATDTLSVSGRFSIPRFSEDPSFVSSNSAGGYFYYNTVSNRTKYYNGSEWVEFGAGNFVDLLTSQEIDGAKTFFDKINIDPSEGGIKTSFPGGRISLRNSSSNTNFSTPQGGYSGLYFTNNGILRIERSNSSGLGSSANLGFNFGALSQRQDLIISDTDITWNGQSLISGGSGGISDGDKGDITVSNNGSIFNIDDNTINGSNIINKTINGVADIQDGSIVSSNIAANAITNSKMSDNSITVDNIQAQGSDGQVLSIVSGDVQWSNPSGSSGSTAEDVVDIVAQGTFSIPGGSTTYNIPHGLGYAPFETEVQFQKLSGRTTYAGDVTLNGVDNINIIMETTSGSIGDLAWRIFGTKTINAGGGGTSSGTDDQTASEVAISDNGNYFTSTEVEGALQELGELDFSNYVTLDTNQDITGDKDFKGGQVTFDAVGSANVSKDVIEIDNRNINAPALIRFATKNFNDILIGSRFGMYIDDSGKNFLGIDSSPGQFELDAPAISFDPATGNVNIKGDYLKNGVAISGGGSGGGTNTTTNATSFKTITTDTYTLTNADRSTSQQTLRLLFTNPNGCLVNMNPNALQGNIYRLVQDAAGKVRTSFQTRISSLTTSAVRTQDEGDNMILEVNENNNYVAVSGGYEQYTASGGGSGSSSIYNLNDPADPNNESGTLATYSNQDNATIEDDTNLFQNGTRSVKLIESGGKSDVRLNMTTSAVVGRQYQTKMWVVASEANQWTVFLPTFLGWSTTTSVIVNNVGAFAEITMTGTATSTDLGVRFSTASIPTPLVTFNYDNITLTDITP